MIRSQILLLFLLAATAHAAQLAEAQTTLIARFEVAERPWGVLVDHKGLMYVACNNFDIRKIAPDGKISPFSHINPQFVGPGMAWDKNDNLLIADGNNILKINRRGVMTELLGGFTRAFDIKVDHEGNMYVADDIEGRVYRITPSLQKTVFLDRKPPQPFWFLLAGIDFDRDYANLYLGERLTGRIFKYPVLADGRAGPPLLVAEGITTLRTIALDEAGNIYALTDFPILVRIAPEGRRTDMAMRDVVDPEGMAFGRGGFDDKSLYVSNRLGITRVYVGAGSGK
jgi:sugar lactone lactonase YvrE